jgi:hypothetical protein
VFVAECTAARNIAHNIENAIFEERHREGEGGRGGGEGGYKYLRSLSFSGR